MKYKFKKPIFDILDYEVLIAIENAVNALFNFLFINAETKDGKYFSENIKVVWPFLLGVDKNELVNYEYEITLLPLNRVGAQEGASGSRVFVTYFKSSSNKPEACPSNPLIFKFNSIITGGKDKLAIEKDNAASVFAFTGQNFAVPLYHSTDGNYGFLWAPFTSSVYPHINGLHKEPVMKENNLWNLITSAIVNKNEGEIQRVNNILKTTYIYFDSWHHNHGHPKELHSTYSEEYKRYLRHIDRWSKPWLDIWGDFSQQYVKDFNANWINPFWVYDRIKNEPFLFKIGAIHGDLHPRNIVISHEDKPIVIDFGWTCPEAHIAKDFALMEANIRFASLHPDYSYDYLHKLSKSIELDSLTPQKGDPLYQWLILIRTYLAKVSDKENFLDAYIIPLFLISLGLLRFTSSTSKILILNQVSARLTVLSLANYIYENKLKNEK